MKNAGGDRRREPPAQRSKRFAAGGESGTIRRPEEPSPDRRETSFAMVVHQAAPYMAAAWTMTAALLIGAFGGRWLDGRLGTAPWLLLLGLLLGLVVGFYELMRVALRPGPRDEAQGPENGD